MISILHNVGTELVLGLLGAVFGTVWTAFKSLDVMKMCKDEKYDEAVRALEAGVGKTYEVYVHHIKEARADGKLTAYERRTARDRAVQFAVEFARNRGVDVVETIGREYLPILITRIVRNLKGKNPTQENGH
jgi:hypothetical protein